VRTVFFAIFAASALIVAMACGKKGPPLPPLVKLPVAPAELTAERRGATVDVQFSVPATNTDNTRPANVSRVDVYAYTGPATLTDDQILKRASLVGRINVKAPRDPNQTVEEDEPDADADPPEGEGLDQGARAHLSEELTPAALTPIDLSKEAKARRSEAAAGPLLPPPPAPATRVYVGVGVTTRGRHGAWSKRAAVPLVPPPPPPASPVVTYDERAVTVKWSPAVGAEIIEEGLLPSRPIGASQPTIAYNVYDAVGFTKLTSKPVAETEFSDARIEWGARRCYTVRTAEILDGNTVESDAPAPTCATLTDTFPPAAPANLQSSPSEGAITLIWDANAEKDLAGYLVFRASVGGGLEQLTPAPLTEPTFRDEVAPGVVYVYAVKAVDKAGNVGPFSSQVRDTAR
jgi:hypothetical protein